jgi:hypothetical protein
MRTEYTRSLSDSQKAAMLDAIMEQEIRKRVWNRVHQSGHTCTWCNGETHIRTQGGTVGINTPIGMPMDLPYPCNCAKYKDALF